MANLHCECQELKPKVETNSSFLVLHPSSGVDAVNTVESHLNVVKKNRSIQTRSEQQGLYRNCVVSTALDLYIIHSALSKIATLVYLNRRKRNYNHRRAT